MLLLSENPLAGGVGFFANQVREEMGIIPGSKAS